MKIKSPISVDRMQFYAYGSDEKDELVFINQFPFDNRHDFLVDANFSGIAVKIELSSTRQDKGARRDISFSLIDMTMRCEKASHKERIIIRKDDLYKEWFVFFPLEATDLRGGHSYKLVVCDQTASQALAESIIHLFDGCALSHPTEWYEISDGGVRPAWDDDLYKSINTIDGHDYYVRFNLTQKFGSKFPMILPELEMRLYYPEAQRIVADFREPKWHGLVDYTDNDWFVEFPFATLPEINGVFYAELLCMEYPIAGFVFDTNGPDERGGWFLHEIKPLNNYSVKAATERLNNLLCGSAGTSPVFDADDFDKAIDRFVESQMSEPEPKLEEYEAEQDEEESVSEVRPSVVVRDDSLLSSLDHLTGLRAVKEKLTTYERVVRFNMMRFDRGLPTASTPLHAMFLGSPGTGKTTIAKMMGVMLHRAGMLSKGHVVVRERATLLGQNYNSEAEKTLAAIEEAQGGILFIDEAYQLYQPNDSRDPGKFVIETLLTALADNSNRDWMLILAGYPDEMRRMFDMNPGFKSRIPNSNIYFFEDFTGNELMEIAEKYLAGLQYSLSVEARTALAERLKSDCRDRGKDFGNARHVINMIQTEILPSMAVRVTNSTNICDSSLTEIQAADIPYTTVPQRYISRQRVGFAA